MTDNWFVYNTVKGTVFRENLTEDEATTLADQMNDRIDDAIWLPDYE